MCPGRRNRRLTSPQINYPAYFLLSSRKDFEDIREKYRSARANREVLRGLIERSLAIKKAMIERDEFDEGPRNVFNYGHSFGHALESYSNYDIPHGIAVTFGMDIANHVSSALGFLSLDEAREMRGLLEINWQPTVPPELSIDRYFELLQKDKKNVGTNVRVILTRGVGDMFITTIALSDTVTSAVRECFDYYRRPGQQATHGSIGKGL